MLITAKEALTDRDPKLRSEGLKALVASDPVAALATISEVLSSGAPPAEKQGAISALAASRTPEAEKIIAGLMDGLAAGKLTPEVQLDVIEAARRAVGPRLLALAGGETEAVEGRASQ